MAAPVTQLDKIVIGGPCSVKDGVAGITMFTESDVVLEPEPTWRPIPSDVGGEHDHVLVDLIWKVTFTPKSIVAYAPALIPQGTGGPPPVGGYVNWSAAGARIVGPANPANPLVIIGSDTRRYQITRYGVTKMPELYCGVGRSMWGSVEYTSFVAQGKALNDVNAFWATPDTHAFDISSYSDAQQESICTANWGSVSGLDNIWAEEGFQVAHEFSTTPVKHGNVTVDHRINTYRAAVTFKPQDPTEDQLIANAQFGQTGATIGIGTRMSQMAQNLTITDGAGAGNGLKVVVYSVGFQRGRFAFSSKLTRIQDWALVTAQTGPGTRLVIGTN